MCVYIHIFIKRQCQTSEVVIFQRHLMQRCDHEQSLSVTFILMGRSTISVFSFALQVFYVYLECLVPLLDQISFRLFFQSSFFIASLSHPLLISFLLPSRYSSTAVCGVLICACGICCFVIGGHMSLPMCIISLPNQTATSFQEGMALFLSAYVQLILIFSWITVSAFCACADSFRRGCWLSFSPSDAALFL